MARFVKRPGDKSPISRQRLGHVRRTISQARRREYSRRWMSIGLEGDLSPSPSPPREIHQSAQTPIIVPYSMRPSFVTTSHYTSCFEMERTPSETSNISDKTFEPQHDYTFTCCDQQAAHIMEIHFQRPSPTDIEERDSLWHLIRGPVRNNSLAEDEMLNRILKLSNSVFFNGLLADRVVWEWSAPSQTRFETELIGTTALRHASRGGFETLIVLSSPILKHPDYDRRLLLSAFLHELVHCYLFILCGFTAKSHGGHTDGFHMIANMIDKWAGSGYLRLCDMKANLEYFIHDRERAMDAKLYSRKSIRHYRCYHSPGR